MGGILLTAIFIYRGVLFVPREVIPWGSDALGHVLKAEYLQEQLARGVWYPNILPDWYMGLQLFRYHPPLPYYLMVLVNLPLNDMVWAANWLIFLCALFGALTLLLYKRWIGLLPAVLVALLYLVLPDYLRVAFAEGNIPRVVAGMFLPLALYLALRLLEEPHRRTLFVALVVTFTLILLSHAMMAPIYAVSLSIMALIAWLGRRVGLFAFIKMVGAIALGLMLGGGWLIPSLVGGLAGLDTSAVNEGLGSIPLGQYLNPLVRTNREIIYVGVALIVLAGAALVWMRRAGNYAPGLIIMGMLGIFITLPGINAVYNALPLSSMMWPQRFLGASSLMLLLGIFWTVSAVWPTRWWVSLLVALPLLADGIGSMPLIDMRQPDTDIRAISSMLPNGNGWRQATLDESRLSSEASLAFSDPGGREQLFGWAYQGSRTATNVAALNEAVRFGHLPYLRDRLDLYGVDDIVTLDGLPGIQPAKNTLEQAGFVSVYQGERTTLLHRDGSPRAAVAAWSVLGIGRGAQNLAYLFPQVVIGSASNLDDYELDFLKRFDTLYLSGFEWSNQAQAEELLRSAAAAGVRVIVDLTGTPDDPLARIPHFLDVWGEQIILSDTPVVVDGVSLGAFGSSEALWYASVPQGLQVETKVFNYLGQRATLVGYNEVENGGKIWFVGANLGYFAAQTRNAAAIALLSEMLVLQPGVPNDYVTIPLEDYSAGPDGYAFYVDVDATTSVLLPFAAHDGFTVQVDGTTVPASSLENLIVASLPAGRHQVVVSYRLVPLYFVGWGVSLAALFVIIFIMLLPRWWQRKE